jgi:hypothetical protein
MARVIAGPEWAIRGEERMNPDGPLYIQLSSKSEEIANYAGTKVHVLSCLTYSCDRGYKGPVLAVLDAASIVQCYCAVPRATLTQ